MGDSLHPTPCFAIPRSKLNEPACNNIKAYRESLFWRSDQTGVMQNPLWESPGCEIYTPRNVTCGQGSVPVYIVTAFNKYDINKAISFAKKYKRTLVIKSTGHDYLGQSRGKGSYCIWTHNLKKVHFTDFFVPNGYSKDKAAVSAVTTVAEQWMGEIVYRGPDSVIQICA
ncbi:hypothetical protein ACGC1H_002457 [Rhizoctonia solani]|uniref:FAD linked oxidase N-terminal domain-containing protein n=1 Tax=Rhizoctonia solani TaxID=456999 RepID=A0A8H3BAN0_9AGAM|nr:unnamed protein product [Rhizoctonia solani]